MSRRLAAATLGLVMAFTAMPVLGHVVSYTTREVGSAECAFDKDVRTDITAQGHHRHRRTGIQDFIFHNPANTWTYTAVDWNVFAMEWQTANQFGQQYDATGSGWGGCVS